MATPTLIYCAGNNLNFDRIAIEAGFKLGAQLPSTTYYPIWFADQNWRQPNRAAYMAALAAHHPHMATVLDWELDDQLSEVLDWASEAALYVNQVLIIPKIAGGIKRLPRQIGNADVVLAYSVPTAFAGTQVPAWEFRDWPVHLLGGSPHTQMRIAQYLNVVSADGNMANKMAQICRYWHPDPGKKGHWHPLGIRLANANHEAFRRSCQNIIAAWRKLNP